MRQAYIKRYFCCPDCGSTLPATKQAGKRTSIGHIKDIYCFKCKKIVKAVQVE